jgi:hypothetical protein
MLLLHLQKGRWPDREGPADVEGIQPTTHVHTVTSCPGGVDSRDHVSGYLTVGRGSAEGPGCRRASWRAEPLGRLCHCGVLIVLLGDYRAGEMEARA